MSTRDPRHGSAAASFDQTVHRTQTAPGKRTRTEALPAHDRSAAGGVALASPSSSSKRAVDPFDFSFGTDAGNDERFIDAIRDRVHRAVDDAKRIVTGAVEWNLDLATDAYQLIVWCDNALQGHATMDYGYVMYGNNRGGSESDDAGMGPSKHASIDFDGPPPSRHGGAPSWSQKPGIVGWLENFKTMTKMWKQLADTWGWQVTDRPLPDGTGVTSTTAESTTSSTISTRNQTPGDGPTTAAAENGAGNLSTTGANHSQWAFNADRTLHSGSTEARSEESANGTTDIATYTPRSTDAKLELTVNGWSGPAGGWLTEAGGPVLCRYADGSVDVLWYANGSYVKLLRTLDARSAAAAGL